jgi:hypothetical protein
MALTEDIFAGSMWYTGHMYGLIDEAASGAGCNRRATLLFTSTQRLWKEKDRCHSYMSMYKVTFRTLQEQGRVRNILGDSGSIRDELWESRRGDTPRRVFVLDTACTDKMDYASVCCCRPLRLVVLGPDNSREPDSPVDSSLTGEVWLFLTTDGASERRPRTSYARG